MAEASFLSKVYFDSDKKEFSIGWPINKIQGTINKKPIIIKRLNFIILLVGIFKWNNKWFTVQYEMNY
jgi:hypothetical protein